MKKFTVVAGLATALLSGTAAFAGGPAEVEVTHWWTSGGEAAAVAEFAKAFNATGNVWVDGAIAGSGDVARPIIISRILGGNPMGATQLNPGTDADDLVAAGLMLDLTDLAEEEGWADLVNPPSQMESCTYDGRVFCVPVNLHSAQWMWINRRVYEDAGVPIPTTWTEFTATASQMADKGIMPLSVANGWPVQLLLDDIAIAVGGVDLRIDVYKNRNIERAAGAESRAVFEAMDAARKLVDPATIVPQWNEAVGLVINGTAAANVMGDWAGGEFTVANMVAGQDYDCLPGLGLAEVLDTGGDVFYFPKNDDPEVEAAQKVLASTMISKTVQVAFNLKKGSLPIRPDVDLSAANDCMQKGLAILASGATFPGNIQMIDRDSLNQIRDIYNDFFADSDVTIEEAQADFVEVIRNAPPLQF
jgi:glucose/mannose transport system substrate-binding protein